jgi:hypothetical protein
MAERKNRQQPITVVGEITGFSVYPHGEPRITVQPQQSAEIEARVPATLVGMGVEGIIVSTGRETSTIPYDNLRNRRIHVVRYGGAIGDVVPLKDVARSTIPQFRRRG